MHPAPRGQGSRVLGWRLNVNILWMDHPTIIGVCIHTFILLPATLRRTRTPCINCLAEKNTGLRILRKFANWWSIIKYRNKLGYQFWLIEGIWAAEILLLLLVSKKGSEISDGFKEPQMKMLYRSASIVCEAHQTFDQCIPKIRRSNLRSKKLRVSPSV